MLPMDIAIQAVRISLIQTGNHTILLSTTAVAHVRPPHISTTKQTVFAKLTADLLMMSAQSLPTLMEPALADLTLMLGTVPMPPAI
jgi:hypothetical protein